MEKQWKNWLTYTKEQIDMALNRRACQSSNLTFYKKYVNSIVRVSRLGVELGHAVRAKTLQERPG